MGRLAWYKRTMGMNFGDLGEAMGRDSEQISDWLSGRHNPFRKNREKIERFLEIKLDTCHYENHDALVKCLVDSSK